MPRNDEGEFELVLGNRQLLSGFFIVVVLFGVFFTMGYIVGRHSSPAPLTAAAANAEPAPIRSSPSSAAPPERGEAAVVMPEEKKGETPPTEQATATQPATAPPEAPRPVETRRVETGSSEPAPGRYLQVAAPKRTAADAVVESLRNRGIRAVLAPGPNEDTVRILVGPLDPANVGKMRVDLESAGFKPFPKNY
jgi:hypothetical protein